MFEKSTVFIFIALIHMAIYMATAFGLLEIVAFVLGGYRRPRYMREAQKAFPSVLGVLAVFGMVVISGPELGWSIPLMAVASLWFGYHWLQRSRHCYLKAKCGVDRATIAQIVAVVQAVVVLPLLWFGIILPLPAAFYVLAMTSIALLAVLVLWRLGVGDVYGIEVRD